MPKIRRGNHVFLAWVGDQRPHHVHVYKEGKLIVKWDLEAWRAMKGRAPLRVIRLLSELRREGRL